MIIIRRYDPEIHHRRTIRLTGYDYSKEGAYFITIRVHDRDSMHFGEIENGKMKLNPAGQIAYDEWLRTPEIRQNIELGEFIIMPDHIHGIIIITGMPIVGAYGHTPLPDIHTPQPDIHTPLPYNRTPLPDIHTPLPDIHTPLPNIHTPLSDMHASLPDIHTPPRSPAGTIGAIVRGYKSAVTKQINILRKCPKYPVWQRNYYEHIIQDESSYLKISEYIRNNPGNWNNDILYQ